MKILALALGAAVLLSTPLACGDQDGSWTVRAPMPTPRAHVAVVAHDGLIYVAGGLEADGKVSDKVEVYDPTNDSWTEATPLPEPRYSAGAANWNGILVTGGFNARHSPQASVFEYDPETRQWSSLLSLLAPRAAHASGNVHGNPVVVGGLGLGPGSEIKPLKSAEWMGAGPYEWYAFAGGQLARPRSHTASAVLTRAGCGIGDVLWDDFYVLGGTTGGLPLDSSETSTSFQEFKPTEPLTTVRSGAAAVEAGGKIYVFGGTTVGKVLADTEVYEPCDKKWSRETHMPTARHGHGAAQVDGVIYVIGGSTSEAPIPTGANEAFTP